MKLYFIRNIIYNIRRLCEEHYFYHNRVFMPYYYDEDNNKWIRVNKKNQTKANEIMGSWYETERDLLGMQILKIDHTFYKIKKDGNTCDWYLNTMDNYHLNDNDKQILALAGWNNWVQNIIKNKNKNLYNNLYYTNSYLEYDKKSKKVILYEKGSQTMSIKDLHKSIKYLREAIKDNQEAIENGISSVIEHSDIICETQEYEKQLDKYKQQLLDTKHRKVLHMFSLSDINDYYYVKTYINDENFIDKTLYSLQTVDLTPQVYHMLSDSAKKDASGSRESLKTLLHYRHLLKKCYYSKDYLEYEPQYPDNMKKDKVNKLLIEKGLTDYIISDDIDKNSSTYKSLLKNAIFQLNYAAYKDYRRSLYMEAAKWFADYSESWWD